MLPIIGIMGPGENASQEDEEKAYSIGKFIAGLGCVVLTGGRNCGVMEAAMKGAKDGDGLTLGILPGENTEGMSEFVDIPVFTNLGNARNSVNVLTSRLVVAIGEGAGTFSEVALAVKSGKEVIWVNYSSESKKAFTKLSKGNIHFTKRDDLDHAKCLIKKHLGFR